MVLKHPGFSATAIVVLALGIGANSAIFSIINAMLLKPLAIHRPGELVGVYVERTTAPGGYRPFSYPNFQDLREQADAFADLAAHNLIRVGIGDGEATRRVFADAVTANYFETFGVPLALGRAFTAAEEQPGANLPVAIVSHDYWVREGRRPDVLGETILVNAEPLTIVGVAAAGFTGSSVLFVPEVWLPLGLYGTVATDIVGTPSRSLRERDNHTLMVKGRLGPGHSVESVAPELEAIAARLSRAYPATNEDRTLRAAPLPRLDVSSRPTTDGQFATLSALVLGMAGVVLLIACLNLANMLLARGASRRREMAIRLSLGGGRGRVVRQLLTEGFVLSVGGGALGLVVAVWAAGALVRSIESVLPFAVAVSGIGVDWRVLLGTLGFCLLGTLFFGLGPAWQMTRDDIVGHLKQRSNPEPRRGRGLPAPRDLLIVGQVALSLALLTAGGLFLRGRGRGVERRPRVRVRTRPAARDRPEPRRVRRSAGAHRLPRSAAPAARPPGGRCGEHGVDGAVRLLLRGPHGRPRWAPAIRESERHRSPWWPTTTSARWACRCCAGANSLGRRPRAAAARRP